MDEELRKIVEEDIQRQFALTPWAISKMNIPPVLAKAKKTDLHESAHRHFEEISSWLDYFVSPKPTEWVAIFCGDKSETAGALVAKGVWVRRKRPLVVSATDVAEWMQSYERATVSKKLMDADVLVVRDLIPIATNRFEYDDTTGLLSQTLIRRAEMAYLTIICMADNGVFQKGYPKLLDKLSDMSQHVKTFKWESGDKA